ncbi:hypothetical protein GCM10022291_25800 [Postechiella marina]|uniref:Sialate O-acetylesterase domain-containing protein n=1 Tax=Postechiella marina TaxID=943941 RepID=A0ABP8CD14_9FLAO
MKKVKYFYVVCLILLVISCVSSKKQSLAKEVHVVLLGGQSNMAGHGDYNKLSDNVKRRIEAVSSRVLLSTSNNEQIESRPLSYYISKDNKKYDFIKHFGPELFIGLTLAEANPNREYLLIKKAVGGTSLYGAWNVNWSAEKANISERGEARKAMQLYSSHVKNIDIQLNKIVASGKSYKILGMVWMQGESDTNKELTATSYRDNLYDLISAYRTHLGLAKMPFVIGQINALPRKYKEGPELVRSAMQEVANQDLKVSIVNTTNVKGWMDYPKHSDDLHYNYEGQKRLGKAFAACLMELNK